MDSINSIEVNGVTYYGEIVYDKGGFNNFSGLDVRRGYYIILTRAKNSFTVQKGLDHPNGAVKMFIKPVGRASRKQLQNLQDDFKTYAHELLSKAGIIS